MWRVREWLALFWPHAWWYSWRRAAHVARVTEAGPDFYGSMDYDAELDWRARAGFLPAAPLTGEPAEWEVAASRAAHGYIPELDAEQTAADLSPEALGGSEGDRRSEPFSASVQPDPGPGYEVSSLTPGPDPVWADRNAERFDSATGGPGSDHPLMLSGGGGPGSSTLASGLGPRAAQVLERYERRRRERWAWVPARVDFTAAAA